MNAATALLPSSFPHISRPKALTGSSGWWSYTCPTIAGLWETGQSPLAFSLAGQCLNLFTHQEPMQWGSGYFLGKVFCVSRASHSTQGFPVCQCRRGKRCGFDPCVGKIPWRRAWQPTPVFLPGESYGQRSLVATVHSVAKSWTRLKWLSTRTQRVDRWKPLVIYHSLQASDSKGQARTPVAFLTMVWVIPGTYSMFFLPNLALDCAFRHTVSQPRPEGSSFMKWAYKSSVWYLPAMSWK